MLKINRRQFLAGLAGLGAAVILPKNATAAQVNDVWTRLLAEPWYFDVGEYGTLVDPSVADPKTRADIWGSIRTTWMETPSDLIHEVECCEPLTERFRWLASADLYDISRQLGDADEDDERARLERLVELLADEDDGWKALVEDAGMDGLPRFHAVVDEWLNDPVAWDEQEWFPRDFGGQGKALAFFENTAADVAEEPGIVIIAGDQPGSTYFGAELRNSIEDANATAVRLGLPFRFRAETS
jgi:hypothetical protein